jgi:hypothetical protein
MHQIEIWVEGYLDRQWVEWLGDFTIAYTEQNESILTGHDLDQAALYGLIGKLRDLGIRLIYVNYQKQSKDAQGGEQFRMTHSC